jgi:hypothetical protein
MGNSRDPCQTGPDSLLRYGTAKKGLEGYVEGFVRGTLSGTDVHIKSQAIATWRDASNGEEELDFDIIIVKDMDFDDFPSLA